MIKDKTRMNEFDIKKYTKNQWKKSLFFVNINKINKPLGNLTIRRTHINKIRDEKVKRDFSTINNEIPRIMNDTFGIMS
jgi:hypothetical protein